MTKINSLNIGLMLKTIELSKTSFANKRKVGAIITCSDGTIITSGINRMPDGFDSECENNEGNSYECVIHAEEDAVLKYLHSLQGKDDNLAAHTIYCTFTPCMNCAKLIVSAGIKKLYYYKSHIHNFDNPEIKSGICPRMFLEKSGVEIKQISDDLIENHTYIGLVYHSADVDGYMCGYLFFKIWKDQLKNGEATLIPYNYGKDTSIFDEYSELYFADVTPPIEWLEKNHKIKQITIYFLRFVFLDLLAILFFFRILICFLFLFWD